MSWPSNRFIITLTLAYLWGGLALDLVLSVLAWTAPQLWFSFFHDSAPQGLELALLRRAAGQWTAFTLAQALALILFRKKSVWLPIMAGIRLSDAFTDLFYMLSAQAMTTRGWLILAPLPLINVAGVFLLLRCYALLKSEVAK